MYKNDHGKERDMAICKLLCVSHYTVTNLLIDSFHALLFQADMCQRIMYNVLRDEIPDGSEKKSKLCALLKWLIFDNVTLSNLSCFYNGNVFALTPIVKTDHFWQRHVIVKRERFRNGSRLENTTCTGICLLSDTT